MDLVIHDMYESARFVLEETNIFRIIKVRNGRNKQGYALAFVFVHVCLKLTALDKRMGVL